MLTLTKQSNALVIVACCIRGTRRICDSSHDKGNCPICPAGVTDTAGTSKGGVSWSVRSHVVIGWVFRAIFGRGRTVHQGRQSAMFLRSDPQATVVSIDGAGALDLVSRRGMLPFTC